MKKIVTVLKKIACEKVRFEFQLHSFIKGKKLIENCKIYKKKVVRMN